MAGKILGAALIVFGLLLVVLAWAAGNAPTIDYEDVAYLGRLFTLLAIAAAVSVLSGVLILTRRK